MPKQATQFDHKVPLDTLPLTEALWWFIENMDADNTATRDVFMVLRERYRNEYQVADKKLASGTEHTRRTRMAGTLHLRGSLHVPTQHFGHRRQSRHRGEHGRQLPAGGTRQ